MCSLPIDEAASDKQQLFAYVFELAQLNLAFALTTLTAVEDTLQKIGADTPSKDIFKRQCTLPNRDSLR
jgi:hypothetical protein